MEKTKFTYSHPVKWPAITGFLLLIPTTFYLFSVFLKYALGFGYLYDPLDGFFTNRIVETLLFFVPFLVLVLNSIFLFNFDTVLEEGSIRFSIALRFRIANLAVAFISLFYAVLMFSYVLVENVGIYHRIQ